ncbi:MAG: ribulose-phosphate 3-epimerase [Nitrospirae bacterium]|nr:ribulose-phosphate 3-epimerase [Nitrospirota bacterium]MBI3351771.1 ribulose-phosphate 3-epimerase [Nitrospirota bacterium]
MKKIAPSILSADFGRLSEEIKKVEGAGADLIHVDVMDGHFVPNLTIGPPVIEFIRKATTLPLDVHLMIENPERYIDDFVSAGSNILTVHVETCPHLHRTIQQIKEKGILAGVTLNPATPLVSVEEIIGYVDLLLIMSVNPGFGGQSFIPSILAKIKAARKMIDSKGAKVELEVDGGLKVDNVKQISEAGCDIFVAGSAIFKSKDYQKTISAMRQSI